jgi:hypothetical protein
VIDITKLMLDASVEWLDKAILPGECHIADRDMYAALFKIISAALGREFRTLVGVKDQRRYTGGKSLV